MDGEEDKKDNIQDEPAETSRTESKSKSIEDELREKKDIAVREASEARKAKREIEKERDALKKRFEDDEKSKLEQDGKYQELAVKAKEESEESKRKAQEVEEKSNQRIMKSELKAAAMAAGIIDLDLLSAIPMSDVKITDDGDVIGVQEAVDKYRESKPYLFKEAKVVDDKSSTGSPSSKQTGGTKVLPSTDAKLNTENVRNLPKPERKKMLDRYLNNLKGMELKR